MTGSLKQPIGDLVAEFCAAARVDDPELEGQMSVRALRLDLPVEVAVEHDEAGRPRLMASPPTQRVATSFLPVFHRLTLRIEREEVPDHG